MNNKNDLPSRRAMLRRLGAAALIPLLPQWGYAQGSPQAPAPAGAPPRSQLPLNATGIEHISAVVPDVAAAGAFYGRVFNPLLSKEKAAPLRYYVPFGVGYLALGSHGAEVPVFFDHFCVLVNDYDGRAMAQELQAQGLPAGHYGIIPDPDKVGFQLLRAPGGAAPTWVPAGRIVEGEPLVTPLALDYVAHSVADLEQTLKFYRLFLGQESTGGRSAGSAWFQVGKTRLLLEATPAGQPGRIARVGVHVKSFNRRSVSGALHKLNAKVEGGAGKGLQFTDPHGLVFELLPA